MQRILRTAAHELRVEGKCRGKEFGLAAVDGEGGGAEQVLKGPAGGEVEADAAGGLAHAGAELEELSASEQPNVMLLKLVVTCDRQPKCLCLIPQVFWGSSRAVSHRLRVLSARLAPCFFR